MGTRKQVQQRSITTMFSVYLSASAVVESFSSTIAYLDYLEGQSRQCHKTDGAYSHPTKAGHPVCPHRHPGSGLQRRPERQRRKYLRCLPDLGAHPIFLQSPENLVRVAAQS